MCFPLLVPLLLSLISGIDCQTQSESVPDPTRVADPSLLPVHLLKPDYRPLSGGSEMKLGGPKPSMADNGGIGGTTEKAADQQKDSATVMNMGEGGEMTTDKPKEETEKAPKQGYVKEELIAAEEAEKKKEEAEGKAKEEEEKAKEAGEKAKEEEEKAKEAGEKAKEEEEKAKEAEEKAKEAEEKAKEVEEKAKEEEEKAKEAEEKAKEAEEKAKEVEEKAKEEEEKAEEKAKEEEEKAKEEEEKAKEEEEKAKEAETKQDETAQENAVPEVSQVSSPEGEEEKVLSNAETAALVNAMRSAKLLVQNITLVVPGGDSAAFGALLKALIGGRSAALDPANGSPAQPAWTDQTMPSPIAATLFDQSPFSANPSFSNCRPISAPQFQAASAPLPAPINQLHSNFLVDVEQLHGWLKSGQRVKVIDASYEPDPGTTDHVQFYVEYYANWDKLMRDKKSRQYQRAHIPGAVPFNLNIATYPSWNERQALYPADKFEQYVQRLGIDNGDRLVIYARGPLGGLLHAARVWFLLRTYGHEDVLILDGGLEAWRRADLPANDFVVETEVLKRHGVQLGNWEAHFRPELIATFEQLTNAGADGYCILSRLFWFNFLDVRPRNEFFGLIGPQSFGPQRNRLAGSKPFPADELVQDGLLAPPSEIIRKLQQIGYSRGYQTIVMGNTADEASLALLALGQVQDTRAKLFNGGIEELRRRAPYLISKKIRK